MTIFFSLLETIENLETKCEELQGSIDSLSRELGTEKRQRNTSSTTNEKLTDNKKLTNGDTNLEKNSVEDYCANCTKINQQLQELKSSNTKDAKSIDDLRDQVSILLQVFSHVNLLCVPFVRFFFQFLLSTTLKKFLEYFNSLISSDCLYFYVIRVAYHLILVYSFNSFDGFPFLTH